MYVAGLGLVLKFGLTEVELVEVKVVEFVPPELEAMLDVLDVLDVPAVDWD